jgi:hypothetical protein
VSDDLKVAIAQETAPAAELLAEIDRLREQLAEARESYRLANQRIIEVLKEKIALQNFYAARDKT